MARDSMPAVARNLAVPPVDTISTPSSCRPRAKSTTPRLSETVIRARWTRTSPGATVSNAAAVRTSVIDYHPARIRRVDPDLALRDQAHGAGQQVVLDLVDLPLDGVDVPRIGKLERTLEDDRAAVDALVDEVHGHPGDLDSVRQRLLDRMDSREGGEQRRVHVDDRVAKARDEFGTQQLHESRQHHEPRAAR